VLTVVIVVLVADDDVYTDLSVEDELYVSVVLLPVSMRWSMWGRSPLVHVTVGRRLRALMDMYTSDCGQRHTRQDRHQGASMPMPASPLSRTAHVVLPLL